MSELSVFDQMNAIADLPLLEVFGNNTAQAEKITKHRAWLRSVRHERPSTEEHFRIGVYIRFYPSRSPQMGYPSWRSVWTNS